MVYMLDSFLLQINEEANGIVIVIVIVNVIVIIIVVVTSLNSRNVHNANGENCRGPKYALLL
jgi:Mg2+ and Co2+ transporter CorA